MQINHSENERTRDRLECIMGVGSNHLVSLCGQLLFWYFYPTFNVSKVISTCVHYLGDIQQPPGQQSSDYTGLVRVKNSIRTLFQWILKEVIKKELITLLRIAVPIVSFLIHGSSSETR